MALAPRNPQNLVPKVSEAVMADGAVVVHGAANDKVKLPTGADPTGLVASNTIAGLLKREGGGSCANGDVVEVCRGGIYAGIAAGSITKGQPLTVADTSGGVKTAAPGGGTNVQIIGYATQDASSGERVGIEVGICVIQG